MGASCSTVCDDGGGDDVNYNSIFEEPKMRDVMPKYSRYFIISMIMMMYVYVSTLSIMYRGVYPLLVTLYKHDIVPPIVLVIPVCIALISDGVRICRCSHRDVLTTRYDTFMM